LFHDNPGTIPDTWHRLPLSDFGETTVPHFVWNCSAFKLKYQHLQTPYREGKLIYSFFCKVLWMKGTIKFKILFLSCKIHATE